MSPIHVRARESNRFSGLAQAIRDRPTRYEIVPGPTETRLKHDLPAGFPPIGGLMACMAATWDRAGQPHIALTDAEAQAMATIEPRIDVTPVHACYVVYLPAGAISLHSEHHDRLEDVRELCVYYALGHFYYAAIAETVESWGTRCEPTALLADVGSDNVVSYAMRRSTHDKVTRRRLGWLVLNSATVRDAWTRGNE